MIRITQVKILVTHTQEELEKKVQKILRIRPEEIKELRIIKQSIDARKKPDIFYSYMVDIAVDREKEVMRHIKDSQIMLHKEEPYRFPDICPAKCKERPIVIGMGPAGLFCAYQLAVNGFCPIIVERGQDVDTRTRQVQEFWNGGALNTESNVQFGEGGAGTFSDGKLNTLVKDKYGRNKEVLNIFVKAGAPARIRYENKPHIGTDILKEVVKHMREEIIAHGGEILFGSKVTGFVKEGNQVKGILINDKETLYSNYIVLAIGHSARDTFQMLYQNQIPMEAKPFAVGVRVEHKQTIINQSQYGAEEIKELGAAPYKVTMTSSNGRGVYSFCMCPGGYVVNASSEEGKLAINGMSYSDRAGTNANSAIIISVTPEDYQDQHPLAGIEFQRKLEAKAYEIGQGKIPVEYYKQFKEKNDTLEVTTSQKPAIMGQWCFAPVHELLPEALKQSFIEGMEQFNKMIPGFAADDVLIEGIESRTSSPVRILRNEELQSDALAGLFPCGEGAGYAGGIMSAAMDGLKVAEQIALIIQQRYHK